MFEKISNCKQTFTFIDDFLNLENRLVSVVFKDKERYPELWVNRERFLYIFVVVTLYILGLSSN